MSPMHNVPLVYDPAPPSVTPHMSGVTSVPAPGSAANNDNHLLPRIFLVSGIFSGLDAPCDSDGWMMV